MKRSITIISIVASVLLLVVSVTASKSDSQPDLSKLADGKGCRVINRSLEHIVDGARKGIRFDERPGPGVAWLDGINFSDGVIEFDVRGKNVLQKSFVGVAFHGVDEKSFDVVYFRPFNFRSDDAVRRSHAVQYVSSPDYSWQRLRTEHPGVYEKPVEPAPDPDAWFHARIVVAGQKISVFVNEAKEPSLVVEKLNSVRTGAFGLFVGDDSGGDFANLKVTGR